MCSPAQEMCPVPRRSWGHGELPRCWYVTRKVLGKSAASHPLLGAGNSSNSTSRGTVFSAPLKKNKNKKRVPPVSPCPNTPSLTPPTSHCLATCRAGSRDGHGPRRRSLSLQAPEQSWLPSHLLLLLPGVEAPLGTEAAMLSAGACRLSHQDCP